GIFVGVNQADDAEDNPQQGENAAQAVDHNQVNQANKLWFVDAVHDQGDSAQNGDQAHHAAVVPDQGSNVAIGDQGRVGFFIIPASGPAARAIIFVVLFLISCSGPGTVFFVFLAPWPGPAGRTIFFLDATLINGGRCSPPGRFIVLAC